MRYIPSVRKIRGELLDPLSLAWIAWGRAEHHPTTTIDSRLAVLRGIGDAGTASRDRVDEWWATREGMADATRAHDLATLRSFYRWAMRWDYRADDPTARLSRPKVPRGEPRPISTHDLRILLDALPDDLRRAVCLGAWGGLRVSEAASLSWLDVDTESRRVRVLGKGGKTRLVGLSPMLLDALHPDVGGNVVTAGGAPYSANALQRRVNRAIDNAGVNATYHQLRHRFGTKALAATGNLLAVSRAMGHANPATTAIYAATSDADLDVIADAVLR